MKDANNNLPNTHGDETIAQIIEALPSQVRALAREAPAWQVPPECLSIAALAHLAAALGNSQRISLPGMQRPAPFSLVMVADHTPGPGRWMDLAGEPWLSRAQELENRHIAMGSKATAAALKRVIEEHEITGGLMTPQFSQAALNDALRLNQPVAKFAGACPHRLAEAMEASFDRSVVSLNGGIDPAKELLGGSAKGASKLAALLTSSWQRQPLNTDKGRPRQGNLTILWQTTRSEIRPLLVGPVRPWSQTPPPVVFLRQREHPAWFPDRGTPAFKGWAGLLSTFFKLRCAALQSSLWTLPDEAWPLLETFNREVIQTTAQQPGSIGRHLLWMPELAIPLALVLTLAKGLAVDEPRKEGGAAPISLEAVQGAIVLTRWLMKKQIETVTWIRQGEVSVPPHGSLPDDTDNADMEAVSENILNILGRKGPITRRELSRSAHEMNAELRDAALRSLIRSGKVRKNGDETVELAAAESLC